MKLKELRDLSESELSARAQKLKEERFNLRIQQQAGQLEKPSELRALRKEVARIETLLSDRRNKVGALNS